MYMCMYCYSVLAELSTRVFCPAHSYTVLVAGGDGGLIEPVCNAISLHQIKKQNCGSLLDYFRREFGDTNSERFLTAQKNFVHSCAAYCLICYFIRVKDRYMYMLMYVYTCLHITATQFIGTQLKFQASIIPAWITATICNLRVVATIMAHAPATLLGTKRRVTPELHKL